MMIPFLTKRHKDLCLNGFGSHLLNLCHAVSCSTRNGVKRFGLDNGETYISPTGSSTIDYFILCHELCTVNVLDLLSVVSSFVESDRLHRVTHDKGSTC